MKEKILHILLIDEGEELEQAIRAACEGGHPIEIRAVASLAEGIKIISVEEKLVVFIRDRLPDGRGVDILRKCPVKYGSPVIIIADNPNYDDAVQAFRAGAKDYIARNEFDAARCQQALVKIIQSLSQQSERHRHRFFQTLQREIALVLSAADELTPACRKIVDILLRIVEIDSVGVFLVDDSFANFVLIVHEGLSAEYAVCGVSSRASFHHSVHRHGHAGHGRRDAGQDYQGR